MLSELLMLSLAACQIDAKAGPILADLVMNTKALEDLNLSSNPLGDTAVLALNLATTRQKNSSMGIMLSLQNLPEKLKSHVQSINFSVEC